MSKTKRNHIESILFHENFQLTVEQAADIIRDIQTGIYIYEMEDLNDDRSLRLIAANPASYQLTKIPVSEIIGKRIDEIFPSLRDQQIPAKYADVVRNKKQIEIDNLLYTDGHLSGIFSIKAFCLPKNRIGIAFENVTERRQAESALKDSEQRYRLLFNSSADAILMMKNDRIIDCNEATVKMFGCPAGKIINETPFAFSPEEQPDGILSVVKGKELIKKAIAGTPQIFEWQHLRCNGTPFDAEVSLQRFTLNNEIYLQSVVRDITLRNLGQKQLLASEMRFRNIFNSSSDGIIIVRQDRSIIESNDIFSQTTGYSRDKILQMKTDDFVDASYYPVINEKIRLLLSNSNLPTFELEIKTRDKTCFPAEINAILIDYEGEKAFLAIVRDIREKKLIEKKILDAIIMTEDREREKFAKNLHDDLGPLLSSIKMYINSLNSVNNQDKQKFVINQLNDIVREAIQSTKEISNDLSPHVLKNYGLSASLELFTRKVEEHIHFDFSTNLNNKRFSDEIETSVYRIIKELINNTIKHSGAGEITLKLNYEKKKLTVFYTDNGKGFDVSMINNRESPGMGLSNIISRVRFLKGNYSFTSEKGKGIAFELQVKI